MAIEENLKGIKLKKISQFFGIFEVTAKKQACSRGIIFFTSSIQDSNYKPKLRQFPLKSQGKPPTLKQKTQEIGNSLTPSRRNNGQKTSLQ